MPLQTPEETQDVHYFQNLNKHTLISRSSKNCLHAYGEATENYCIPHIFVNFTTIFQYYVSQKNHDISGKMHPTKILMHARV